MGNDSLFWFVWLIEVYGVLVRKKKRVWIVVFVLFFLIMVKYSGIGWIIMKYYYL